MARSKLTKEPEIENTESHRDGQTGESQSSQPDATSEVSFLTQIGNYLFGGQAVQCDAEKSGLELIKSLVEDIDSDYTNGRPTLFDNDRWAAEERFMSACQKSVNAIYLPFDCEATHIAKSNGCGAHLIRWYRQDVGVRCASSYDTHVFELSDESGQCGFKPTGEKIYVNDLIRYLTPGNQEAQ